MKNKAISLLLAILLIPTLSVGTLFAQEDTEETAPVEVEQTVTTSTLSEDDQALQNDLLLKVPSETDNPNYTLTFTNPSEEPITLSIDGTDPVEIASPYSLPALGIGKHTLLFNYTNSQESPSSYETTITIIPRPPVIKPPEVADNTLLFSGTAVPGSILKLFLTGAAQTYRNTINVKDNGSWEYVVDGEFENGVYTATAYITKNGFGSDLAEPVTFNVGTSNDGETKVEERNANDFNFSLSRILTPPFYKTFLENKDFLLFTIALLVLGVVLGILLNRFIFNRSEKSLESRFKSMLSGNNDSDSEEVEVKPKKSEVKSVPLETEEVPDEQEVAEEETVDSQDEEITDEDIPVFDPEKDPTNENSEEASESSEPEETDEVPEYETIADKPEESKKKGVFGFFRKGKKDSEAEDEAEPEDSSTEQMTRDEFLEKFKDHDPDPVQDEKKISMTDKIDNSKKGTDEDSETEEETQVDSTPKEKATKTATKPKKSPKPAKKATTTKKKNPSARNIKISLTSED